MMTRLQTTEAVVSTLLLLANNPGIKSREIAAALGVSPRTALRYIERLRRLGLDIDSSTGPSGGLKARWHYYLRPLVFTGAEAVTLFLAARVLTGQEGFPYRKNLQDALDKIGKALASDTEREFFNRLEPKLSVLAGRIRDYLPWESKIEALCRAARDCRVVRMEYDSAASEKVSFRCVDPYHVLLKEGAWYLVGYCHERKELRTFRVDRILSLALTEDSFAEPDFDIEDYFKHSWRVARGKPVQVKVQFFPPAARYIREGSWHPSETKTEQPDGSLILTVTVEETWEIKQWILGWGRCALVLEPESLRQEIAGELGELLRNYRGVLEEV